MKQVSDKDELLLFHIPDNWVEEPLPNGGTIYYPPDKETPTLRLNILFLTSDEEETLESMEKHFITRMKKDSKYTKVVNGNLLISDISYSSESGIQLRNYHWEVADLHPPRSIQLGIFSLTTEKRESTDDTLPKEYLWLEKEIKNLRFSRRSDK